MNKAIFLSVSSGYLAAFFTCFGAAPALAQGEHVPASGYCTGETIQISGWEQDLVHRNKGLEKFHWSAINTVQHYNVVPTIVPQRNNKEHAAPQSAYHNTKPQVVSTWSTAGNSRSGKTFIASADNGSRASVNAHLRSYGNGTSTYAQMARGFDYSNQQSQYGGDRSLESKVSARMLHY